ncbi:MAG: ribosome small subunit-dependent GTPase A [Simkaniaceae bacterium]
MGIDDHLEFEEHYHEKGQKRASRKQRRLAISKDRSKFKKTDAKKEKSPFTSFPENIRRGRVLAISKEGVLVNFAQKEYLCVLKGSLKKEKTKKKNLIIVGDFVLFTDSNSEMETIVHVEPRTSFLSRADNLSQKREQLIAANIDQAFITVSLYYPYLKPALVDRYLIAAKKGHMHAVIIINKIDFLTNPPEDLEQEVIDTEKELFEEFLKTYTALGYKILLISTKTEEGIETLKEIMQEKASVFVGQSGVGKTSLINAATKRQLRVGSIVEKTKKGSHTTTSSILLPVEGNGFVIDTPGIKSFGLWDLTTAEIRRNFPEMESFSQHCRYPNCSHMHEPDCAVQEAVDRKKISLMRFESYQTLMNEALEKKLHNF